MEAKDIKFGIEIECYIPMTFYNQVTPGRYHRGNSIRVSPRGGWNAQNDGSLSAYHPNHFAAEIVSPRLVGEDGLNQVWAMVEILKSMDAQVDTTCGLHIHVDATGLNEHQVRNITRAFICYELAFYGLGGEKAFERFGNHYCTNAMAWARDPFDSRYQSLNLQNLRNARKRTIEIRCFCATLEPDEIVTAVYMAVALVAKESGRNARRGLLRITDPREAMARFAEQYWTRPHYRIIPDETANDCVAVLSDRVAKAMRTNFSLLSNYADIPGFRRVD